jgi:DNA-binding response OmpR family regulator
VEDEWLIAESLATALVEAGYDVVGPAATVSCAMAYVDRDLPDLAILDINLGNENSFPVATMLMDREVPFVFVSGYTHLQLPIGLANTPLFTKPADPGEILRLLQSKLVG